ncbi:MAG: hypothetical protein RL119_779, partial [Actinomycetota bacterium]
MGLEVTSNGDPGQENAAQVSPGNHLGSDADVVGSSHNELAVISDIGIDSGDWLELMEHGRRRGELTTEDIIEHLMKLHSAAHFDEVAGVGDLALVGQEHPAAAEDPVHLVGEDRRVGIDRTVYPLVLDQGGVGDGTAGG